MTKAGIVKGWANYCTGNVPMESEPGPNHDAVITQSISLTDGLARPTDSSYTDFWWPRRHVVVVVVVVVSRQSWVTGVGWNVTASSSRKGGRDEKRRISCKMRHGRLLVPVHNYLFYTYQPIHLNEC
jgi:hypothetical protein